MSLHYRKRDSVTYWYSTAAFIHVIHTKMITWWQTSLSEDGHSFLHSCCKFLKSSKLETNLIHERDFASVELFSVTYLGSYLARKCKTQQSCKQTVKQLCRWQRFTLTWMKPIVREMNEKSNLKQKSGIIAIWSLDTRKDKSQFYSISYLYSILKFSIDYWETIMEIFHFSTYHTSK